MIPAQRALAAADLAGPDRAAAAGAPAVAATAREVSAAGAATPDASTAQVAAPEAPAAQVAAPEAPAAQVAAPGGPAAQVAAPEAPAAQVAAPGGPAAQVAAPEAPAGEVDDATRWALAARTGDPAAQAAFVRATQTEVWRLAAALVDPDAADDLAQETYLRAFRSLPAFEGRSSARTWLLGITRRVCADHLRSVVRRRRLRSRLAAHPEPERSVMAAAEPDPAQRFDTADLLRRLPADRRGAFVLTQLLGLSYAEAAAVEGVPVGTIRSRVARARAELVAALG